MIFTRLILPLVFAATVAAVLFQWHLANGFDALDVRWWIWLVKAIRVTGSMPTELLYPVYWTAVGGFIAMGLSLVAFTKVKARTINGGRKGDDLHGTARLADEHDVKRAGLMGNRGVVVGGWPTMTGIKALRHDGPEHVMCFAPTRSGKGVGLVVPTLLQWHSSALILDIKGENYALSAGWIAARGHRVLRFEPAAETGSVRFNPLAEVRLDTSNDIADCQNIASMIIDPDGKGLKDYWMQEGWSWLSVAILHVLYRIRRDESRIANLADVNAFMSAAAGEGEEADASFLALLEDMLAFEHGFEHVDREVKRGASRLKIKASNERSGVHSSASVQLALYADPIVARNIGSSDFRLSELMDGDTPAYLYIVIEPSDIDRLRPLVRVLLNIFLRRLTSGMTFSEGRADMPHKHRLLLMLDEFTSVGKLDIFERALAFMGGYGLKAFIIVQDMSQLQQAYGRDESISSNCHIRIAYAPNRIETAKTLSEMTGKQTVVQIKRSRSGKVTEIGSISDSISETSRPLLTPDECMRLRSIRTTRSGKVVPGEMLIFVAGTPPILGRQFLYFQDRELLRRSKVPPPVGRSAQREALSLPDYQTLLQKDECDA